MKTTTRAFRYLKAAQGPHSLSESWKLLSKPRRRYARYLVERYGYPVKLAIQQAYIFGFDAWPYLIVTGVLLLIGIGAIAYGIYRLRKKPAAGDDASNAPAQSAESSEEVSDETDSE